ncbi:unnamed protein product [Rhizophagus irregularis]|nr:unnamed protein product [Rhizophagus irregularis]
MFCGDSYDGGVGRHLGSEIVVLHSCPGIILKFVVVLDQNFGKSGSPILCPKNTSQSGKTTTVKADSQQSYFTLRLPVKTVLLKRNSVTENR